MSEQGSGRQEGFKHGQQKPDAADGKQAPGHMKHLSSLNCLVAPTTCCQQFDYDVARVLVDSLEVYRNRLARSESGVCGSFCMFLQVVKIQPLVSLQRLRIVF